MKDGDLRERLTNFKRTRMLEADRQSKHCLVGRDMSCEGCWHQTVPRTKRKARKSVEQMYEARCQGASCKLQYAWG